MKKITTFLLASCIACTASVSFSASAEDNKDYAPTLYFKVLDTDNIDILKSGAVFINKNISGSESVSIPTELYIEDTEKLTGAFTIMWHSQDVLLRLSDLTDPITLTGSSPYKAISSPTSMNLSYNEEKNRMIVNFTTFSTSPLELNYENSDDCPLAGFNVNIETDLSLGSHKVEFLAEERTYLCSFSMRYSDGTFSEKKLSGDNIQPLLINISDRMLGDVNGNGLIDAVDASTVLSAYAKLSSNQDSGLTPGQEAAADVNGDGYINAVDASSILSYYAYISTHEAPGLVNYLK